MTRAKSLPEADHGRRRFLKVAALSAGAAAAGCTAKNPVTGESQLMFVSRQEEIAIDQQQAPQQFSADYGPVQDDALNVYVSSVGEKIAELSHRPDMPYSFRVVNAAYVNAYAFPGGSIACTRGILVELDNEAQLAALLGHEIGHVNARHTASRMSKGMVTQLVLGLGAAAAGAAVPELGQVASTVSQLGTSALLAHYSRDDERQADDIGMEYMTRAQYSPKGMIQLMEMLNGLHEGQASGIETLFATHPMSSERLQSAVAEANRRYAQFMDHPLLRSRFMDHTVALRKIKPAILDMRRAMDSMGAEKFGEAESQLRGALKIVPDDYAALLMLAKACLAQKQLADAATYAARAREVYPEEPQAHLVLGYLDLNRNRYSSAYEALTEYDRLMPGNPDVIFMRGLAREGMNDKDAAAKLYYAYLRKVNSGEQAQYAYMRLKQWGYLN